MKPDDTQGQPLSHESETLKAKPLVVEMRSICKVYGNGITANRDVDFSLRAGEIHALIGENGAGKSTLMKMLFGLERPTSGTIAINGEVTTIDSPATAIAKGIGMVHQHFMLVPSLTVAENMVLGAPPKKGLVIDRRRAIETAQAMAERYGFSIDPHRRIADSPVGMKQKVEIVKALMRDAKILILDEPTAVLTARETDELFAQLKRLRDDGITIVFISHRLREIKRLTDRMTIMRAGRTVGVYETAHVTEHEISKRMVGRDVVLRVNKPPATPGDVVLSVRHIKHTNAWNTTTLNDVSFDVRAGEIVGIAGVEGNGQRELVDIIFDLQAPDSGTVTIAGTRVSHMTPRQIRSLGVSLIPEDRMTFGIAANASIADNIIADRIASPALNAGPLLRERAISDLTDGLIASYRIKAKTRRQAVGRLSGGNIQKVVVARELSSSPRFIIADQPTRGIDVGASELIHTRLVDMARQGAAVLLVSADLSEVMELSDRLLIMHRGEIVGHFTDVKALDDVTMGEYMLGLKRNTKPGECPSEKAVAHG